MEKVSSFAKTAVMKSESTDEEESIDELEGSVLWSQEEALSPEEVSELPEIAKTPLNSLCRLCAGETQDPVYIFSELGESLRLPEKINNCLSVKVRKTDPLPKQLCGCCLEKVTWCDDFDLQCFRAEETLREILRDLPHRPPGDAVSGERTECCPLCREGEMKIFSDEEREDNVVSGTSDEEPSAVEMNAHPGNEVVLKCLGSSQKYLKCRACVGLYPNRDALEMHRCKPLPQTTSKPYKCNLCANTFNFEERLRFHQEIHARGDALFCEPCNLSFGKELKLFYHYKRYHYTDDWVSCLQCGKLFHDRELLRSHICTDGKNRPHVCEVCSKGFCDGYTLKRHVVTHLPEKPYKCLQCSKSFTQKSRLNKHVAGHNLTFESCQTIWSCGKCGEAFSDKESGITHLETHEEPHQDKASVAELQVSKLFHCEFCDGYFPDSEKLKHHLETHVVEHPYICRRCNTTYKSFAEAALHWKEHPRSFLVHCAFLCEVCGKETKELSLLYKHKRRKHEWKPRRSANGGERFICEFCGGVFQEPELTREHGRQRCSKFPCDICGSLLPTGNSLNAHRRRHSGLRPYVCDVCGKSYTQSSHMWTHKRFHLAVKPYACQFCEQRFTIKPDLADHTRKKHTRERPFKCNVCGKAFLTGSVFYQHRLIHRGDRRYKCHYCEKAFTRTEALNNHVKIHTGEKPHACDVCGRRFRQKGDMRKHRRTQHPESLP